MEAFSRSATSSGSTGFLQAKTQSFNRPIVFKQAFRLLRAHSPLPRFDGIMPSRSHAPGKAHGFEVTGLIPNIRPAGMYIGGKAVAALFIIHQIFRRKCCNNAGYGKGFQNHGRLHQIMPSSLGLVTEIGIELDITMIYSLTCIHLFVRVVKNGQSVFPSA